MLPLFYTKIAALSVNQHRNVYIESMQNVDFAKAAHAISLQVSEFKYAMRDYPIVFIEGEQGLQCVVITGIEQHHNLFIDEQGQWDPAYVPAYVRRYPFVIANIDQGQATVCIDEAYPGINQEAKGQALFTEDGEHSAFLTQSIQFLEDFEQAALKTKSFCQQIQALELLEDKAAQFTWSGDQHPPNVIQGFKTLSKDKLAALSAEQLKRLHDNGVLEHIYYHWASLEQFTALFKRHQQQA